MEDILNYPLTPVPLALYHIDGTTQKTPKTALKTSKIHWPHSRI